MWLILYVVAVILGSALVFIMWSSWGLSWKQIGIFMLFNIFSSAFFRTAREMRQEAKQHNHGKVSPSLL